MTLRRNNYVSPNKRLAHASFSFSTLAASLGYEKVNIRIQINNGWLAIKLRTILVEELNNYLEQGQVRIING